MIGTGWEIGLKTGFGRFGSLVGLGMRMIISFCHV